MRMIKNAKKYLGAIEGSKKHKEIINGYNKIKPLPQGYKVKYSDQWCATFVSYIASISNMVKFPYECSVPRMWNKAKKNKQTTKRPKKGYLIIYDWNNNKSLDHVGIVESVKGQVITTIEGNYSDSVKRRKILKTSSCIYGYIKTTESEVK